MGSFRMLDFDLSHRIDTLTDETWHAMGLGDWELMEQNSTGEERAATEGP